MYELRTNPNVSKFLENPKALSRKNALALARRIEELRENPRPHDSEQLKGAPHRFRLTHGEYRVLYEIDESDENKKIVTVVRVGHRKDVYR